MKLDGFITEAITNIANGIYNADKHLRTNDLGEIWANNINTAGSDMVSIGLLKGDTGDPKVSIPVMAVQFDVKVSMEQEDSSDSSAEAKAGVKVLSVIDFGGKVGGKSGKRQSQVNAHSLTFTVPVKYNYTRDARTIHVQPK
jgi:hypothetical protein